MTTTARLLCLATAAILMAAPASAQEAGEVEPILEDEPVVEAEPTDPGLQLKLSPGARVSVDESLETNVVRLSFWHQEIPLGPQVAQAAIPAIRTFSAVPVSRNAVRLDLRLDPSVKGISVVRTSAEELEVHFSPHSFAGSALRLARRQAAASERDELVREDAELTAVLATPAVQAMPWFEWEPITWPMGTASPVRVPLPSAVGPYAFSHPPAEVRELWSQSELIMRSVAQIDQGEIVDAVATLAAMSHPDDWSRAAVALARGHAWSQPRTDGEPMHAGRAGDAFLLAAALKPNAPWAAWARGQAGYCFERERRPGEAIRQFTLAIEQAPTHADRPFWELGVGLAQLQKYRVTDGVHRIASKTGGLPKSSDARFVARQAVAHALWREGQSGLAASVVDLLLAEHPEQARNSAQDLRWSRMYLDAGRSAAALPYLERIETEGMRKVDRERARWWLHEAALSHRDSLTARKWLKELIDSTPGSVLVPMAKARLQLLDAIAADGSNPELSWQQVALDMRTRALEWPYTPIEDETLSMTAQLFAELGMVEEALDLYRWIEVRTPKEGGAIAYEHIVCELAPLAFNELRDRGELVAALGIYRGYLDNPSMHGCVDISTRADAAATAVTAGLPDLAARWLGQAVAEGNGGFDEARNLVALAQVYLQEGKIDAADQTLEYLDGAGLPRQAGVVEEAWGDVRSAQERWDEAAVAYTAAIAGSTRSVRRRAVVPSLRYRRGLARAHSGDLPGALADLRAAAPSAGARDEVLGWLRLAAVALQLAESPVELQEVITACNSADDEEPSDVQRRALAWYRAQALQKLGQAEEADALFAELVAGTDSWALLAQERLAAADFEASLDSLLAASLR